MSPQTPNQPPINFIAAERQALRALRSRYLQDRDHFTGRELARLRFVRWLYQTGRLAG